MVATPVEEFTLQTDEVEVENVGVASCPELFTVGDAVELSPKVRPL